MPESRDDDHVAPLTAGEEAAEWFVRVKDSNLTSADRRKYVQWLKKSPVHIAEMLEVSRLHRQLYSAKLEKSDPGGQALSNIIELATREITVSPLRVRRANARCWKIAAAFSAFTLATLLALVAKVAWFDRIVETEAGEWRDLALVDGSIVRAGPRTRLRVAFGDTRRVIHLSGGEAVFQVATDPARPFVVSTELAVVRAVGTRFGVSHYGREVIVTVSEGRVAVSQSGRYAIGGEGSEHAAGGSVPVSAGEQIAVSRTWPVAVRQVNVERELAWTQRRLIFESSSVAEAIDEFNRRNQVQIDVKDPALAARPVHGVFDAADPQSFAEFLETVVPNAVVRKRGDVLLLEPKAEAGRR